MGVSRPPWRGRMIRTASVWSDLPIVSLGHAYSHPEFPHAPAFTTFLGGSRRVLCPFDSGCGTSRRGERVHRRNHIQRQRTGGVLRTWRSRCESHCRREEGREGEQLGHLHGRYDVEGRKGRMLPARRHCFRCCSRGSRAGTRSRASPCSRHGAQDRSGQSSTRTGTCPALRSREDCRSGADVQRNRQFGEGGGQRSHRRDREVQGRDVFTLCTP
jgi:hypothetical protein